MDIAAVSMQMSQFKFQQELSMSITKKVFDTAEMQMEGIVKMLDAQPVQPVQQAPPSGHVLDIRA